MLCFDKIRAGREAELWKKYRIGRNMRSSLPGSFGFFVPV